MSNKIILSKNRMIDLLIKDRILEIVFANCYEDLEYLLRYGFEGFENMKIKELRNNLDNIDIDQVIQSEEQGDFEK